MRNFGHNGPEDFWGVGINGKNSEFHAAMGLCNLPHIDEIIAARKQISEWYDDLLQGSKLTRPVLPDETEYNFAYYPVILPSEEHLLRVRERLNEEQIFPRRYFYPSLSTLNYVGETPYKNSDRFSKVVLCLPLYVGLTYEQTKKMVEIIRIY